MKLSIIIPVYNMEKYLEQCMESILNQTYKGYEIILVNDGSTDSSSKIIEKYEKEYKEIKAIYKENGGLSDARNVGINNVSGDYILFVESDDFLNDKNALRKIMDRLKITNAEVLNFGFKKYYEDKDMSNTYFNKIKEDMPIEIIKLHQSFEYLCKNSLYIACAWNKVIKRELFSKYSLEFKSEIYSEDIEWCGRLAIVAKSFDFINTDFYSYRQRKSSISKNMSDKNIKDLKDSIIACCEYAESMEESFKRYFLNYVSYQFGTFLICQANANYNKTIQSYIDEMSNYQYLLNYRINKKIKILYYLNKVIGYKNLCKLIRKFYNK